MTARFGGLRACICAHAADLTTVMCGDEPGAGETVLRILEQEVPILGAIIHFGAEEDLIRSCSILKSMACDCGATTATRVHPRFYGSFPRVLGRYVREQKIMRGNRRSGNRHGCRRRPSA